jgi:hypothetical protein
MGLRNRRAGHISHQCRTRSLGCLETTAKRLGRSSWRPRPAREDRTARSTGGHGGNRANGIYGCDRSDRYGAVEPARDRDTCSDCDGSSRRDSVVGGRPMSNRDIPLERRRDGIYDFGISVRRQTAIIRSGRGTSVECTSHCDREAAPRRSHDASGLRTLRG